MPIPFNKYIGNWTVSNVEDMDHMFDGASDFDQNLSCWDVEDQFKNQEPEDFATRSSLPEEHLPKFGEVPNIGCHYIPELPASTQSFIISILIEESNKSFTWPVRTGSFVECTIDWGDGTTSIIDTDTSIKWTHTYESTGLKTVSVTGTCGAPHFAEYTADQLVDIIQWGNMIGATDWSGAFQGCYYLINISASDMFGVGVLNTSAMFADCPLLLGTNNMQYWDMSSNTDMSEMFLNCTVFNQDISSWNVSSVQNMSSMFENATLFNSPLTDWQTLALTNMSKMFKDAETFNQRLSHFITNNVSDMSGIFVNANKFNQYIGAWNVSNVITMAFMFNGTNVFNQNLSCWNVRHNPDHTGFYDYNTEMSTQYFPRWGQDPNQKCVDTSIINPFKIKIVILEPGETFTWPTRNQYTDCVIDWGDNSGTINITDWNDPAWTHTYTDPGTFIIAVHGTCGAPWFEKFFVTNIPELPNTNLFDWSFGFDWENEFVNNSYNEFIVQNSSNSFKMTPIGGDFGFSTFDWVPDYYGPMEISNTIQESGTIINGAEQIIDIIQWGILTGATDWSGAFYGCYYLENLSASDSIQYDIQDMSWMFADCHSLDTFVNDWSVESVINFSGMFAGCDIFNHDLYNWNTSAAKNMSWMFADCYTFNKNITSWNISNVNTMDYMFNGASSLNKNMFCWNVYSNPSHVSFLTDNNIMPLSWYPQWGQPPLSSCDTLEPFIIQIHILNDNDIFTWPTRDQNSDFYINWGDNSPLTRIVYSPGENINLIMPSHTYRVAGTYNVSVIGTAGAPNFGIFSGSDTNSIDAGFINSWSYDNWTFSGNNMFVESDFQTKVYDIINWGNLIGATDWSRAFEGCSNLTYLSAGAIPYSITNMSRMFYGCSNFNSPIIDWNVYNVTDFSQMFYGCSSFTQPIGSWTLGPDARNMSGMFEKAISFNSSLSAWNQSVSVITDMSRMFANTNFNSDISLWNTSSCVNMASMFENNNTFNIYIGYWNVSNVTNFTNMIPTTYSKNLSCWNVNNILTNLWAGDWEINTNMVPSFKPRWGQSPNIGCSESSSFVNKPFIISPVSGTETETIVTFVSDTFNVIGLIDDTHASSSWQISTDPLFNTNLIQSLYDVSNKTSWTVSLTSLNTLYYARVKYTGTQCGDSLWSNPITIKATINRIIIDWSKVYLHMDCEGTENGTTFLDDSNNNRTISSVNGSNANTIADAKKFNNTGIKYKYGTYLSISNTPSVALGRTWTIEMWVIAHQADPYTHTLIGCGSYNTPEAIQIVIYQNGHIYAYDGTEHTSLGNLGYGIQRHLRITSDGNDPPRIRVFIDGILTGSYFGQYVNSASWFIGAPNSGFGSGTVSIDEVLITQECLSTTNFIPATVPYTR